MEIRDLVSRRSDLSTFLVHLTRKSGDITARAALKSIINAGTIEARSVFGHAKKRLKGHTAPRSQHCVCFTETPLEYTHLMFEDIENRDVHFAPYGIAITKRVGRLAGINPVWYLDITPGHDWLASNIDNLLDRHLSKGKFTDKDLEKLVPYMEQMGTNRTTSGTLQYRKEFWWEREWRFCGRNFPLPDKFIGLCPEEYIDRFEKHAAECARPARFVDPRWGLERIIAHLAGFDADDTEIL